MSDTVWMDKIQKLLNQANDPSTTDAERETFMAKADQLMFKHKIDDIMLRVRNASNLDAQQGKPKPVHEKMEWVVRTDPFWEAHADVAMEFSRLTGVRLVFTGNSLSIFGYPNDVQYFRMLWTSSYMVFSAKMDPKWDKSLPAGDNIRLFLEAGIKWLPVWYKAREAGDPLKRENGEEVPAPPGDNGWMKRQYRHACAAAGEEPLKLHFGTQHYRDSYALGFTHVIEDRVWKQRAERDRIARETDGAALVLVEDANAIEDLLRATYPHLGYGSAGARRLKGGVEVGARRGAAAASSVDFNAGGGGMGGGTPSPSIGAPRPAIGG